MSDPESEPTITPERSPNVWREIGGHLREDVGKVQDPRLQALPRCFGGLEKAFRDYEAGIERAWKR